tara:strand:+ start:36147 stop:36416 length:270 start_codon:yes stop_codon:yes gene_type:complete
MPGKIKKIHVNQFNIKKNIKREKAGFYSLPCVTVKHSRGNIYGHEVKILGESTVRYPRKPLECGARIWIETCAQVEIHDWVAETITIID